MIELKYVPQPCRPSDAPAALLCALDDMRTNGFRAGQVVVCRDGDGFEVVGELWPSRSVASGNMHVVSSTLPKWEPGSMIQVGLCDIMEQDAAIVHLRGGKRGWKRSRAWGIGKVGSWVCGLDGSWAYVERMMQRGGEGVEEGQCCRITRETEIRIVIPKEEEEEGGDEGGEGGGEGFGMEGVVRDVTGVEEMAVAFEETLRGVIAAVSRGKWVLLEGHRGSGFERIAHVIAHVLERPSFVAVEASQLLGWNAGDAKRQVDALLTGVDRKEVVVLVEWVDDAVGFGGSEGSRLGASFDVLHEQCGSEVVVLGSCVETGAIPGSLLRPGRFNETITIRTPNEAARAALVRMLGVEREDVVDEIAKRSAGFVLDDLERLLLHLHASPSPSPFSTSSLEWAFARVRPSAQGVVGAEVARLRWEDIGGMEECKSAVREAIEWPLRSPALFAEAGVRAPRGALLYGPPGCSKTMLARALACNAGLAFLSVKGAELLSKYLGDSEKAVAAVFARARAAAPALIFLDEVDALAPARTPGSGESEGGSAVRDRVVNQLLAEMDGFTSSPHLPIAILAATNRPDLLDPALLRPGRIDRLVYVPPPDHASRRAILLSRFGPGKTPNTLSPETIEIAASEWTKGFSGAEVVAAAQDAAMKAISEAAERAGVAGSPTDDAHLEPQVTGEHLQAATRAIKPQITDTMLRHYSSFSSSSSTSTAFVSSSSSKATKISTL